MPKRTYMVRELPLLGGAQGHRRWCGRGGGTEGAPLNPALGQVLASYGYDDAARRIWMRDALNRQTGYTLDERGWVSAVVQPDGSYDSTTWNNDHRLKTRTDRLQRTTSFAYDAAGRLLTKTYSDTSTGFPQQDPIDPRPQQAP